jgi:hypothetical protein
VTAASSTSYADSRTRRLPLGPPDRRHRLSHRFVPLGAVAGTALVIGIVVGALYVPPQSSVADRFVRAWERGDYVTMYGQLAAKARRRYSLDAFIAAYADAAQTATQTRVTAGHAHNPSGGAVAVPVTVWTRIFGRLRGTLRLPFDDSGSAPRIAWRANLTFPGAGPGERLNRRTYLPPRASIRARDGKVLAAGEHRVSDVPDVAAEVAGQLGPLPPDEAPQLRSLGYPPDARVGVSGLERALELRLAGTPGGELLVGRRVIANALARPAAPVRSTISVPLERAAIAALGGRYGGIAVLRPATGDVLALAGLAYSASGPPGSTFKIVTTTAALEAHRVRLSDTFGVQTAALLDGVRLSNAGGEACGGTFVEAFAQSCNSVFAPLGVRVGKQKLVAVAERYGFNEPPLIAGAALSQIPPPSGIGDDLDLGSTAIGQGKVLASPLQMASVAATVGEHGLRVVPHLVRGERVPVVRVTTPAVAATLRKLMLGVVEFGTGTAAQIPGVQVAGKTGTAELGLASGATDAWFTSFAPARAPTVVVSVWRPLAGAGGDAAAPIAHDVLAAALGRA